MIKKEELIGELDLIKNCTFKVADIIKINKLKWTGHVVRMENCTAPKKVLTEIPEGKKDVGRLKVRY